jgi:hypothetical protein
MENYVYYWNNDTTIVIHTPDIELMDDERILCIIDNKTNNIINKIRLLETRVVFSYLCFPESNTFIDINYKYHNHDASIIITYYNINTNFEINQTDEIIIPSFYSCGNVSSKVCKLDDNYFSIVCGDLYNQPQSGDSVLQTREEKSKFILCNQTKLEINESIDIDSYNQYCFISNEIIIESSIIALNKKYIHIKIFNKINNQPLCGDNVLTIIRYIKLPCEHRFNNEEVESEIIDFGLFGDKILCLLRCRLEYNITVLNLEYYYLDILVDVLDKRIISISDKFYNDITSSIKYDASETPSIWSKEIKNLIVV